MSKISSLNNLTRESANEHECRAAAINTVLLREKQMGRDYITNEGARLSDLIVIGLMQLGKTTPNEGEIVPRYASAPATNPQPAHVRAYDAVEDALNEAVSEAKTAGIAG